MDVDAEKAIEWIKRAQERARNMPECLASDDVRRYLNEARELLEDKTELAKQLGK